MNSRLCWLFIALLGLARSASGAPAEHQPGQNPAQTAAKSCISRPGWTILEETAPRSANPAAILADMAKRDVVLLGEHHDDEDHHRWQAQALAGLHAQHPDMVIGFEMFPRRTQPALDRWVAGELTAKQFLEEAEWDKVWNVPAELYLPLFQFARINRIPMLALNVDPKLNKAIVEKGWDGVPATEREGVGQPAPPSEAYRDYLFKVYGEHASFHKHDKGKPKTSDKAFNNFVESQTTWDRAMAEVLASKVNGSSTAGKPLVVGIMGSGHLQFGYGVPHQLKDLGVKKVGTLIPMPGDAECQELQPGLADAVFSLPTTAQAKPEPPRLGVRLEQKEDIVRIVEVVTGSLAEKSGLKTGDQLLEVAGLPARKVTPVTASIRRQPDGSWLPMRVKRGEDTLDLVIKFPPKP